jgi:uncharacterized membrane-anchored protein
MNRVVAAAVGAVLVVVAGAALMTGAAFAQSGQDVIKALDFRKGEIAIGENLARLSLTQNFSYLSPADTETFLTKAWGNPPDSVQETLGMILPADVDLLGADGWAIVVSYDESGHVSDEDANSIDYAQLLEDMQEATRAANDERTQQGFEPIELIGWAKEPRYDSQAKKLHWAKRLRFGDEPYETLNYEIRILGREGVLDLTFVAGMESLPMIERRMEEILTMVAFQPGNTYAEFQPGVDNTAAYGLAGLVAGGVLAKAGFFKVALAFLLASKKLLIIGVVAVLGGIGAFFRRLRGRSQA